MRRERLARLRRQRRQQRHRVVGLDALVGVCQLHGVVDEVAGELNPELGIAQQLVLVLDELGPAGAQFIVILVCKEGVEIPRGPLVGGFRTGGAAGEVAQVGH